jgi:hypothetical protein
VEIQVDLVVVDEVLDKAEITTVVAAKKIEKDSWPV